VSDHSHHVGGFNNYFLFGETASAPARLETVAATEITVFRKRPLMKKSKALFVAMGGLMRTDGPGMGRMNL
jgi:hypothetical protein